MISCAFISIPTYSSQRLDETSLILQRLIDEQINPCVTAIVVASHSFLLSNYDSIVARQLPHFCQLIEVVVHFHVARNGFVNLGKANVRGEHKLRSVQILTHEINKPFWSRHSNI